MSLSQLIAAAAVVLAVVVSGTLIWQLRRIRRQLRAAESAAAEVKQRFAKVVDAEAERDRVLAAAEAERRAVVAAAEQEVRTVAVECDRVVAELHARRSALALELDQLEAATVRAAADAAEQGRQSASERAELETQVAAVRMELLAVSEQAALADVGLYEPRFALTSALEYELRLQRIRDDQKAMVKSATAATCETEWSVEGSAAAGRRMIAEQLKLMLRAFNGESDAAVARVNYRNYHVMVARIRKAWEAVNKLGASKRCAISPTYLRLKIDELDLAFEYEEKLQAEKEEQRRIREQMREEELAQRELERARQDAEKEEKRYADALQKARDEVQRAVGARHEKLVAQIAELDQRLAEAHERKERAISRAQMTRSGHVYVISNIGSFGEHVYKIGMTRRLDPFERIRELGDASVPFQFDVHAVIYSDDAPALEAKLHRLFTSRRINRVNERKEFFFVTMDELAAAVEQHDARIALTRVADAAEFRKTLAVLNAENEAAQSLSSGELPDQRRVPVQWRPMLSGVVPVPSTPLH